MTAHLIHHLLMLFAYCPRDRRIWLSYFRHELPGMPRGWYWTYAHRLIKLYPYQMSRILHGRPSNL